MHTISTVPLFKVHVKAVDANGDPVAGAAVETSQGQQTSTDTTGMATIKFGAAGLYTMTVMASNRAPSTFTVTMPADHGDTLIARLGHRVTFDQYTIAPFITSFSTRFYPMMFNWMFSTYGYSLNLSDYKPGEWTEWKIVTEENGEVAHLRKAFLKENKKGQQWWQIRMMNKEKEDEYIVEVLFSEDRSSILRIREKIGEGEPSERPVTEGWYTPPQNLTRESIKGATQKQGISLKTPAGSFTADLVTFGVAPNIDLKMWRVNKVPGGIAKYLSEDDEEDQLMYRSTLIDYGDGAVTLLNSY